MLNLGSLKVNFSQVKSSRKQDREKSLTLKALTCSSLRLYLGNIFSNVWSEMALRLEAPKSHWKAMRKKIWEICTRISNILVWAAFLGFQQKRKDAETSQDLHGHTFPITGVLDASAPWDLCGSGFHRAVQQNIPWCLFVGSTKEKIHISASPSETGAAKEQQPCYKGSAQP